MYSEICPWGEGPDTIFFKPSSASDHLEKQKPRSRTLPVKEQNYLQRPSTADKSKLFMKEIAIKRPNSCRKHYKAV